MALITWPSGIDLRNIQWSQAQPEQVNRSGWTGRTQIAVLPQAARWTAQGEFPPLKPEQARLVRAFAFALKGRTNTFRLEAVEADQHSGSYSPHVAGSPAAAGAYSLTIANMAPSTTFLKQGQLITVYLSNGDEQLVGLEADLITNSSGVGVAYLGTPLRATADLSAAVITKRPWGLMRAVDPAAWNVEPGALYRHNLSAEEAF